jgi:hypothetical protein
VGGPSICFGNIATILHPKHGSFICWQIAIAMNDYANAPKGADRDCRAVYGQISFPTCLFEAEFSVLLCALQKIEIELQIIK